MQIDKSGRETVLSLSPGPAMIEQADHLRKNANMWRITNDLWDSWENIMEMFTRCNTWSPYVSEGCYPDCDMIPIGHLLLRGCEHGLGDASDETVEGGAADTVFSVVYIPFSADARL